MNYPLTTYTCWIRFRCGTFSFHSSFATYYCLSNCNGNLLHRHHVNHSFCNHYGSVCAFYADNVCVVNAVCRRADAVCNLNVVCRLSDCLQTICRLSAYLMTSNAPRVLYRVQVNCFGNARFSCGCFALLADAIPLTVSFLVLVGLYNMTNCDVFTFHVFLSRFCAFYVMKAKCE
jgi:hypothetical protein